MKLYRNNIRFLLTVFVLIFSFYGGMLICFLYSITCEAYTDINEYSSKDKIVYVDGYADMRKAIILTLSKHGNGITISYPGIVKDFNRFRKNNYMDLFDRLSLDNGYYTGILSGTCISFSGSEDTEIESISFQFNYLTTKKQEKYITKKVKKIASKYKGKSKYAKIKGVHDYLVDTMKYDSSYYNPYYAFSKGKGICMSYALAYQRILQEMNIPCIYVKGNNHAWNMVKYEGKWYGVDVTWDDSRGNYKYFLKGTADFYGHRLPKSGSHKLIHKARFSYKK